MLLARFFRTYSFFLKPSEALGNFKGFGGMIYSSMFFFTILHKQMGRIRPQTQERHMLLVFVSLLFHKCFRLRCGKLYFYFFSMLLKDAKLMLWRHEI